jgi:methionyl-tRNA formyltransferase
VRPRARRRRPSKRSLACLLRAYEVELGLCTGFPWLIPQEAIEVPPLGIVNGHPSLLPRYRDRLARGDRGDEQPGGEYQSRFEDEYGVVDQRLAAADLHRRVRAWGFLPPFARTGPVLEHDGTKLRLVQTSLSEVDGAERLDCADGPLWIVASEPA